MKDYEEYHEWSARRSWLFILLLSFGLIAWAMTMMTLVKDVPRAWDFGTQEFTPGKSIYSTGNPKRKTEEDQIHRLPEAVPLETIKQNKNAN